MAASDEQRMTLAEIIEDTRRDHRPYRNELWGGVYCRQDNQRWPCLTVFFMDEIERLQALLAERDAEIALYRKSLSGMLESYDLCMGTELPFSDLTKDIMRGAFINEIARACVALATGDGKAERNGK